MGRRIDDDDDKGAIGRHLAERLAVVRTINDDDADEDADLREEAMLAGWLR